MHNKFTYEFVKNFVESRGYFLLSTQYIDQNHKLSFKCDKGHIYETPFSYFRNGNRCPECFGIKRLGIDEIAVNLEKWGYTLLSNYYKNNKTPLVILCDKWHIYTATQGAISSGHKCPECMKWQSGRSRRLPYDIVKKNIEDRGFILLSKTYHTSNKLLDMECPVGHKIQLTYNKFQGGRGCKICNQEIIKESLRFSYSHVLNFITQQGYQLLSKKYVNVDSKLKMQCPKGHIFKMSFWHFKEGNRCSVCWKLNRSSNAEKQIQKYIIKKLPNDIILTNDRTIVINPKTGNNLELDVYIPKLKKAVEYNGIYWHSSKYAKYKDRIKKEQCKKKGIELLVLQEKEWLKSKDNIYDKLDIFLGGYKPKSNKFEV